VISLCDKSFWPKVDIGVPIGAPLSKRLVGDNGKIDSRTVLKVVAGRRQVTEIRKNKENAPWSI
jgi:hypothetical protein